MARKRKGRDVSGWLCVDKAVGRTSTQVVASVKRLFDAAKVGHAGTLDPLASGILPIALGDATKTVPHVQDAHKVYRFTVRWGAATDTDDADGTVTTTAPARPDREAILGCLGAFIGEIMQRPPAYSAIKIEGARAYDLAREGEEVVLAERPVMIHRLDLVDMPDADHAIFEAECGKGAYVRALARDMGERLGCFGHVVALRRLSVGPFDEAGAITLETLISAREEGAAGTLDRFVQPIGVALGALPEIVLSPGDAARVRRGQSVILRGRDAPAAADAAHATHGGLTLAVGHVEQGAFHPKRVFRG
jgi:tRNA pseudouridine55 synthase